MSGYNEIGAGCFADGYIAAGGAKDMVGCATIISTLFSCQKPLSVKMI